MARGARFGLTPSSTCLVPAALLAALLSTSGPARAQNERDWRVDGPNSTNASVRAAARALCDTPGVHLLAERIWKQLGAGARAALLDELRRRAQIGNPRARAHGSTALGHALLLAGHIEDAVAAFSLARTLLPDSGLWSTGLAEALARAGRPHDAAVVVASALEKAPSPGWKRDELLEALARHRGQAGDNAGALDAWLERFWPARLDSSSQAAAGHHERPRATRGRSETFTRVLEDAVKSARLFDLESRLRTTRDAASVELHVRVLELLGDLGGAKARALQLFANHPRNRGAALRALALCEAEGDWTAARGLLTQLVAAHPRDLSLALRLLDLEWRELESAQNGAEPDSQTAQSAPSAQFRATLARFRGDGEALTALADFAAGIGRDDLALMAWQAVLRVWPHSSRALTGLGEVHYQRGRRELARATWSRMTPPAQTRPEVRLQLAQLLAEHDFFDEALTHIEAVLATSHSLAALRLRAQIEERRNQPTRALATWQRVLERARATGNFEVRRETHARMLTLVPQLGPRAIDAEIARTQAACNDERHCDADDVLYHAALERAARRPDRALALLEGASERFLDSPSLVGALYEHYRQAEQIGSATRLLERFAELNPARAAWAFTRLAELARDRGQREAALAYARRGLAHSPNDPTLSAWVAEFGGWPGPDAKADGLASMLGFTSLKGGVNLQAMRAAILQGKHPPMWSRVPAKAPQAADEWPLSHLDDTEFQLVRLLGELSGTLLEIEHALASALMSSNREHAALKLHVEVLAHLVPGLYARPNDVTAASALRRISQLALLPLLVRLRERPSAQVISLIGMLGRVEAVPELMRIARTGLRRVVLSPHPTAPHAALSPDDLSQIFIALGRLGDPRPRQLLLDALPRVGPGGQAAALWALGRLSPGVDSQEERDAILLAFDAALGSERQGEPAAFAALALARSARVTDEDAITRLCSIALSPVHPVLIRRAAALGLAIRLTPDSRAARATASPALAGPGSSSAHASAHLANIEGPTPALRQHALFTLSTLLESEYTPLRRTAARALAGTTSADVITALWRSALRDAPAQQDAALHALLLQPAPLADEARLVQSDLRAEPVLAFLERWPLDAPTPHLLASASSQAAVFVKHQGTLGATLARLLETPSAVARVATLRALARHVNTLLLADPGTEFIRPALQGIAAPALQSRLVAPEALAAERRLAFELLARLDPGRN